MSWVYNGYCSEETEVIFEAEEIESSEDPPMQEWSSLMFKLPEVNQKMILHSQGLYDPGSGELCAKYIGFSKSSILLQHVYNNYPAVIDPGIQDALLLTEKPITYPDDGQELYLAMCKEMEQIPIKSFFRDLLNEDINLAYYCLNPKGVRAMTMAISNNTIVTTLNLTDNFLTDDSCYHLGEMLITNSTLKELNLSGCKIKTTGLRKLLMGLKQNWSLKILNLNRNEIGDDGAEYVAKAVTQGLYLRELHLSYNSISARGSTVLAGAFETPTTFIKLDFSWNNFMSPGPTYWLLAKLGESDSIQEIDFSWCALAGARIGSAIKFLMKAPFLRNLNLSNNGLSGEAVSNLIGNIGKAHSLETLDLSFNPLTPSDALIVLLKMKSPAVRIQSLLLENIYVNHEFLDVLREVKEMKCRKNFFLIYGGVISSFKGVGPDIRELVLKRADYLSKRSKKTKKHPADIALMILQLKKDEIHVMPAKDFSALIRASGVYLDPGLTDTIVEIFGAPSPLKNKEIDVNMLEEYVKRLWPDRKLPPTPSPEPESDPVPLPVVKTKQIKKGKSKRK